VEFLVTKNTNGRANEAKITIYNLSLETRDLLAKDRTDFLSNPRACSLKLGCEGRPLNTIISGDLFYCSSYKMGVNWLTEFSVLDGGSYYQSGHISLSFSRGTSWTVVINSIVKRAMDYGLDEGQIDPRPGNLPNKLTLDCKLSDLELDGFLIFVENNRINIIQEGHFLENPPLEISGDTGLIESPLRYENYIEISTLLESEVALGQRVKLISSGSGALDGFYQILGFSHRGSISFQGKAGECITTLQLQK
jgi:hypothetical protein